METITVKEGWRSNLYLLGKAREKLKWADGKAIKSEIDMQVKLCPAVSFELQ